MLKSEPPLLQLLVRNNNGDIGLFVILTTQLLHEFVDNLCSSISDHLNVIIHQRVLCKESVDGNVFLLIRALDSNPGLMLFVRVPLDFSECWNAKSNSKGRWSQRERVLIWLQFLRKHDFA